MPEDHRCLASCNVVPGVLKRCVKAAGHPAEHLWVEALNRTDGPPELVTWEGSAKEPGLRLPVGTVRVSFGNERGEDEALDALADVRSAILGRFSEGDPFYEKWLYDAVSDPTSIPLMVEDYLRLLKGTVDGAVETLRGGDGGEAQVDDDGGASG